MCAKFSSLDPDKWEKSLHLKSWLPVRFCVDFKILMLIYKALHGLAPEYLSVLLTLYTHKLFFGYPTYTLAAFSHPMLLCFLLILHRIYAFFNSYLKPFSFLFLVSFYLIVLTFFVFQFVLFFHNCNFVFYNCDFTFHKFSQLQFYVWKLQLCFPHFFS